ncbi:MAG TPA: hypothetical protein VJI13_03920 [Candidatus Norongarragalinales archaeon]|nr:hypothetical protein [Candidatus Norongarragalinales archaeon]
MGPIVMWKVVAVFLFLLVLSAISAIKREGFYWMLALFSSFLAVGILLYISISFRKSRESEQKLKEIRSEMGRPAFAYRIGTNETGSGEPVAVPLVDFPKVSEPEHHADSPGPGEIHMTQMEVPKMADMDLPKQANEVKSDDGRPSQKIDVPQPVPDDKGKDSEDKSSVDLVALRAKIRKDQDEGKV